MLNKLRIVSPELLELLTSTQIGKRKYDQNNIQTLAVDSCYDENNDLNELLTKPVIDQIYPNPALNTVSLRSSFSSLSSAQTFEDELEIRYFESCEQEFIYVGAKRVSKSYRVARNGQLKVSPDIDSKSLDASSTHPLIQLNITTQQTVDPSSLSPSCPNQVSHDTLSTSNAVMTLPEGTSTIELANYDSQPLQTYSYTSYPIALKRDFRTAAHLKERRTYYLALALYHQVLKRASTGDKTAVCCRPPVQFKLCNTEQYEEEYLPSCLAKYTPAMVKVWDEYGLNFQEIPYRWTAATRHSEM